MATGGSPQDKLDEAIRTHAPEAVKKAARQEVDRAEDPKPAQATDAGGVSREEGARYTSMG
ncbi:hypothetical protein NE236_40360 [Actinoallomurus purpureus]|uniref:hypothetical protein n=1 Tax=Actinoallomurus purpureus TaxID=478114 RepID=UPI002093F743|nr:hypothetical protein [Actinoallomurus purpureus]MCO6011222.1 hypothetical protein [Actinoallomurus purpureus]